ncbi:hypothetical protein [Amycolatopsis sp. cmx-4-68]|uniref:hypothetical protein n=1 Tax=Amycolatopsis sp. cmx-4-68 TaxID=2790938 RepID=UPI0039782F03
MNDAVSRFPITELEDLPDDLRERVGVIAGLRVRAGHRGEPRNAFPNLPGQYS